MQTCYNCGKTVDDSVLICPDCGALVRRYTTPPAQEGSPELSDDAPRRSQTQSGSLVRDEAGKLHLRGFVKVWLILCAVFMGYTIFSFLFVMTNSESILSVFNAVDPAMGELLQSTISAITDFSWMFLLMGGLMAVKVVCCVWFLLKKRRLTFFIQLGASILLALPSVLQLALFGAALECLDVLVIWLCLKKDWRELPA